MRMGKRGEKMAQKKMGRSPSANSMKKRIFVRVNRETDSKLHGCMQELHITLSDVVRKGIDMVHDSLNQ